MLDYKDYYMLNLLSHTYQTLSVDDLSKLIGVSRRSIYYSLNKINEYLTANDLPAIENLRDEGVILPEETKDFFKNDIQDALDGVYVYTQKERIAIEIMLILTKTRFLSISDFEELFMVSRNTIISDVKELRKMIATFNLTLEYEQGLGYFINGTQIRIRSVLLYTYSSYNYLFKINRFDVYDDQEVKKILCLLNRVEEKNSVSYVAATKEILAKLLATIKKHNFEKMTFNKSDIKTLEESSEFQGVNHYFKSIFPIEEQRYITLQLMGLRVNTHHDFESSDDEYIDEIVNFIIKRFKELTLIDIKEEKILYEGLYFHMKSALIRYKYGIIYDNELKEDLKEEYQAIYRISEIICKELEEIVGNPVNEDDIAYMAMHFGGHLKREKNELSFPKILLVCLNGIATSKLLRKEVEHLLENIEIIDAVRLDEIKDYADDVDYIITTVPIDIKDYAQKTLMVSPILTALDRDRLFKIFNKNQRGFNLETMKQTVYKKIEKEFDEDIARKIIAIVDKELNKHVDSLNISKRKVQPMLNELITEDKIIIKDKVDNYQEAIYESAKPLLEGGYIEDRYLKKVIQNIKDLGPYIVIAPNVAISHARPEDGVIELGMSILILDEAVSFSNEKERNAKLIVTLAAPDDESHLKALGQLSELLMNSMDDMLASKSKEDVLNLIKRYSK
ncbi:BglG family transcription antiterminator [Alkalibacter saccharofermentans]|uniref:Transcriptional antiterminator n=1 Tax=Alkalibacter saccharofermentans DSM 14828 TaxID=1120975 RepID=A0A1M4ZJ13_9FIRM|nr:BglG family transcription antiterminator [Alkalibacter saccharofermentans]SHF18024.1 Transcriptional antiterminator [Alkalibacter saccharofermentans DSM 14828]